MKIMLPLLALALLIAGCAMAESDENAVSECINACKGAKAGGRILEHGPCLLNPMPMNPDWVCDVAHEPRTEIDNRIQNQCSAFRAGAAGHFVEVSPDCEFIKKY